MKWRALGSILVALLLVEAGLRATGRGPWRPFDTFESVPTMSRRDAQLGWTNLPGVHTWSTAEGTVVSTIESDGSRARVPGGPQRVVAIGGSFVFGFGLSDDAVFTHALARTRPDLTVENWGCPGYGTLQSLLLTERIDVSGADVVYGLVELHEGRNAGSRAWLRALERSARDQQAWVAVPSAHWTGDELVFEPPVAYEHWPWSEKVALIDAVERSWIGLSDRLLRTKAETTVQLVLQLRDTVEARGGRFHVAALSLPNRADFYLDRLRRADVHVVDLRAAPGGRLRDGHPDAETHASWARTLAQAL